MSEHAIKALDVALEAACESSRDLEQLEECYEDRGDRNEQWANSYIGCRLNDFSRLIAADKNGIFVTYEARASWLAGHTGATNKRGPKSFRGAERFDVAVWNRDNLLEGLVEVKDAPAMDQFVFAADTKRLMRALDRWGAQYGGSLSWGLVVFNCRLSRAALSGDIETALISQFNARMATISATASNRMTHSKFRSVEPTNAGCCVGWGAALIGTEFRELRG